MEDHQFFASAERKLAWTAALYEREKRHEGPHPRAGKPYPQMGVSAPRMYMGKHVRGGSNPNEIIPTMAMMEPMPPMTVETFTQNQQDPEDEPIFVPQGTQIPQRRQRGRAPRPKQPKRGGMQPHHFGTIVPVGGSKRCSSCGHKKLLCYC